MKILMLILVYPMNVYCPCFEHMHNTWHLGTFIVGYFQFLQSAFLP